MTLLSCDLLLAAARDQLPDFYRTMRTGEKPGAGRDLLITLLALLAVLVLLWLAAKWTGRPAGWIGMKGPRALFLSLCRVHGLTLGHRWLLWRLARQQRLKDPARLFLEPERFDADRLGPSLGRRKAELAAIRRRLFQGLSDEPAERELPAMPEPEPAAR